MEIALIVASSENGVIGVDNNLPWRMPADLQHFKKITMGYPIVMGRKTYDSIGRPLPGRQNIILSRDVNFNPPGCTVVKSKEDAIQEAEPSDILMVIGGATVYQQFLSLATKVYLTIVHTDIKGDAFFPKLDHNEWGVIREEHFDRDEHNPYAYSFYTYEKR